jgi:carboxylate-amine ligase
MGERGDGDAVGAARPPADITRNMPLRSSTPIGARSALGTAAVVRAPGPDAATRMLRSRTTDSFSFGIEEEYFLVDRADKSIILERPARFLVDLKQALGDQATTEMLQSQVEVATLPHVDMATACAELRHLRHTVADVAAAHGCAILAAGTHPTADWWKAIPSAGKRYETIMADLGVVGKRDMLCGMHVHVELPNSDDRVDAMYRMLPYVPLFMALATSSPFWQSEPTGLMGYRLAAYDELPRTGIPELFRTREEFDSYVEALTRAGIIDDASYVWWTIRPSLAHPTLELRAPDSCTFVEDSIAIAALYRALAHKLTRDPLHNADLGAVQRAIIIENKWRAQRYGIHGTFADLHGAGAVTVPEMLDDVLDDVWYDAEALGCTPEILRCRAIVNGGTSADMQLSVFEAHCKSAGRQAALAAVADWLAAATIQ